MAKPEEQFFECKDKSGALCSKESYRTGGSCMKLPGRCPFRGNPEAELVSVIVVDPKTGELLSVLRNDWRKPGESVGKVLKRGRGRPRTNGDGNDQD